MSSRPTFHDGANGVRTLIGIVADRISAETGDVDRRILAKGAVPADVLRAAQLDQYIDELMLRIKWSDVRSAFPDGDGDRRGWRQHRRWWLRQAVNRRSPFGPQSGIGRAGRRHGDRSWLVGVGFGACQPLNTGLLASLGIGSADFEKPRKSSKERFSITRTKTCLTFDTVVDVLHEPAHASMARYFVLRRLCYGDARRTRSPRGLTSVSVKLATRWSGLCAPVRGLGG